MFLLFVHWGIKPLNFPLDPHHLAGAIISALQFYKGWKGSIALQGNVSEPNVLLPV
jgi:hypothetical protein